MMGSVLTFGETMGLATSRTIGPMTTNRDFIIGFGGAESNVAIGLARLGHKATWVSRLGRDGVGDLIARELRAEGVEPIVIVDTTRPTGFMIKERRSPSTTVVTYYRAGSAASALTPADVLPHLNRSEIDLLHVSGITPALSAASAETAFEALTSARKRGIATSFDLNYRSRLWTPEAAARAYRRLLPHVDVVFAGLDEATLLDGNISSPDHAARALGDLGPHEVVIKLGSDGAFGVIDGTTRGVPAHSVEVVDTVGAGDAFVAGYLGARLEGLAPDARLRSGALSGAFACTVAGDWEGAPKRADLVAASESEHVQR